MSTIGSNERADPSAEADVAAPNRHAKTTRVCARREPNIVVSRGKRGDAEEAKRLGEPRMMR